LLCLLAGSNRDVMKILLTGASGYIGRQLLPVLISDGHQVVCGVRDLSSFNPPGSLISMIDIIRLDLLDEQTFNNIPDDIDGAYYLVHSMAATGDFSHLERKSAVNFRESLKKTKVRHVIYLGGIINDDNLSEHLISRKRVEEELAAGDYNFTSLRAGIIIGSGSASFEIIRDLVEKLPVMITPEWLNTRCQPAGIADVLEFLSGCIFNSKTYNRQFDIGGPDILTFKEMLVEYANTRGLKRKIIPIPVMTPKLSSYWLYFITSTSYRLATTLVSSMKTEVVCSDQKINELLNIKPLSYRECLARVFDKIEWSIFLSDWESSFLKEMLNSRMSDYINVPTHGCFIDERKILIFDDQKIVEKLWSIGGENGWYYGNFLRRLRGFIDKLAGRPGPEREQTRKTELNTGDKVDSWRVLYADKSGGRLVLYSEMKLPGEAWLEFKIQNNRLVQTSTFRPKGVAGRLYWYAMLPFHSFLYGGLLKRFSNYRAFAYGYQ
jgi:uncharacterized protein YbjT (DUF2867 family)